MNTSLHRYSKLAVLTAFTLIVIGSLVTTNGAGMAFADWPLSSGSVSPDGWWTNFVQRLEHGHRLFAELTGLIVAILCAWVWSSRLAVPLAIVASGALSGIAVLAGASRPFVAHVGLWSTVLVFAGILFMGNRNGRESQSPLQRWLAFAAFCGVVVQAVLGGFRVTLESSGNVQAATTVRIIHGCFAQIELCLLVALASVLSAGTRADAGIPGLSRIRRLAWLTFGLMFAQLVLGATIRHLGIALVIPTFPLASPHGLMPAFHNACIDLNFTHTRFMALVIAVHVLLLSIRIFRTAGSQGTLVRPAWLLLALLVGQIVFGIEIIWTYHNPLPVTLHVVNGAALLTTCLLIALRSSGVPAESGGEFAALHPIQPGVAS